MPPELLNDGTVANQSRDLWLRRFALDDLADAGEYSFVKTARLRQSPELSRDAFERHYAHVLAALHPEDKEGLEAALWEDWQADVTADPAEKDSVNWRDFAHSDIADVLIARANRRPRRLAVRHLYTRLEGLMATLPQGRDKALGILEAAIQTDGSDLSEIYQGLVWAARRGQDVRSLVEATRARWLESYRAMQREAYLSHFFWPRRTGEERLAPLHHLVFAKHFDIAGFDDVWDEVYEDLSNILLGDLSQWPDVLLLLAWEPSVADKLQSELAIACRRIVQLQEDNGSWRTGGSPMLPEHAYLTAIFTFFLHTFAATRNQAAIHRAAQWLLANQQSTGCWTIPTQISPVDYSSHDQADLITTVVAALVLFCTRSDPQRYAIDGAIRWTWLQQSPTGAMDVDYPDSSSPYKFVLTTLLVIATNDFVTGRSDSLRREAGVSQTMRLIKILQPGTADAYKYQELGLRFLKQVFGYALTNFTPQQEQNQGRGVIDTMADNVADAGVFFDIKQQYNTLSIPIEFKNESSAPANAALNQLAGRMGAHSTRFGLLLCRRISDEPLLLSHLHDRWSREHKMILVLDDSLLERITALACMDDRQGIEAVVRLFLRAVEQGATSIWPRASGKRARQPSGKRRRNQKSPLPHEG